MEISEQGVPERPRDRWIAVDGGLDQCRRLGREPDFAVGDWDSLEDRRLLDRVPHLTLSQEKERGDFFHGLLAAASFGFVEVEAHGFTGGRPDHLWAVLADSARAVASGHFLKIELRGPEGGYYFFSEKLRGGLSLALPRGAVVSVFPAESIAKGVTARGLRYPLRRESLTPSSRGLSNRVDRSPISIRCVKGVLLVIVPDPWSGGY
jgi:thiamine pyrophosphokinase